MFASRQRFAPPAVVGIGRADSAHERHAERASRAALSGRRSVMPRPAAAQEALAPAPDSVTNALNAAGQPLEADVRGDMERRFGGDFSAVRVHADAAAARSAGEFGAHAYAVGNDIVFGAGRYAPGLQTGRQLLAHELAHVVQRDSVLRCYRPTTGFNFGKADDSTLHESSFDVARDREKKPWINRVQVEFTGTASDGGATFWIGRATATYHDNPVKLPDLEFPVAGGSAELGLTSASGKKDFIVTRIEGVGYNSGTHSGTAGRDFDPSDREGPRRLYSKDLDSNMSFAVFFHDGEALHAGPLKESSHGCVHVDWNDDRTMKQLNYHSVIGLTKVSVSYPSLTELLPPLGRVLRSAVATGRSLGGIF